MIKKIGIVFVVLVLVFGVTAGSYWLTQYSFKHSDTVDHKDHVHTEISNRKTSSKETVYTCPMHPEIRQNKPGSCPICHMKLVKVPNENTQNNKTTEDAATFNVSPYQANLVGIKPIKVKQKLVSYSIPVSGRLISKSSLALQVFERDLRYIKSGVKFLGQSEVYPEDTIRGVVTSVDTMADPSSRTVRVLGRIIDGGRNSLVESSFTGQVVIDLGEKLVVPEKSVLFTGGGSFVYLYKGNRLHPQQVTLGAKVGEEYVILKGLAEGEMISSGPNFLIDSESKIRGVSRTNSNPVCPSGQQWNIPMEMCMPSESL